MKKVILTALLIFCGPLIYAQELFPVIEGYGGIVEVDKNEFSPDVNQKYKLLFDVTLRTSDPSNVNPGLDGVARVLNLHSYAGVSDENIDMVVTIRQGATYSILDNEYYNGKFEMDNPNLDLVDKLLKAGVKIFVCGQNLKRAKISQESVVDGVSVALSAFTTTTHFRMKGYAYYKF